MVNFDKNDSYLFLPDQSISSFYNEVNYSGVSHFQSSPRTSIMINAGHTDQTLFVKDETIDNNQTALQPPPVATTSSTHLLTPSSTPTTQRRNRRISNLFVCELSIHPKFTLLNF